MHDKWAYYQNQADKYRKLANEANKRGDSKAATHLFNEMHNWQDAADNENKVTQS